MLRCNGTGFIWQAIILLNVWILCLNSEDNRFKKKNELLLITYFERCDTSNGNCHKHTYTALVQRCTCVRTPVDVPQRSQPFYLALRWHSNNLRRYAYRTCIPKLMIFWQRSFFFSFASSSFANYRSLCLSRLHCNVDCFRAQNKCCIRIGIK